MPSKSTENAQKVALISSNKQAIAGFAGGLLSSILTYPLDLIKTRFQSAAYDHYSSLARATSSIVRESGLKGLYAGINVSIIGTSLSWGAYFGLYAYVKDTIRAAPNTKLTSTQHLFASFASGAIVQVASNPLWVIKTNAQLNATRGIRRNAAQIYGARGIIGFYRGVLPGLFGVLQSSLHFVFYERSKYWIQDRFERYMTPIETILITMYAKTVSTILTYPYQVVRTRMQHVGTNMALSDAQQTRFKHIASDILYSNGVKGFYRGMWINLIRIMPSTCITFLVFETVKTRL